MTGTLGLFSLVDLFQLLASSTRTGRLLVDHPEGTARVYFDKGRVVHAEFGEIRGEEAVYALFEDERGDFEFGVGLPAPDKSVKTNTENLMMEAIRRLDETRRDQPEKVKPLANDAVPAFADDAPDVGNLTLEPHEVQVLRLVDAQRDLTQIADEAGVDVAQVKMVISRLAEIGALKFRSRKPRIARLVAALARAALGPNRAMVDTTIMTKWAGVLGYSPQHIACRRPDGLVDVYEVTAQADIGPNILFSRETLLAANLAANTTLLVQPVNERNV